MQVLCRQAPQELINIYKLLAIHYGFSPRLLGVMCSEPIRPAGIEDQLLEHTVEETKVAQSHVRGSGGDLEMQYSQQPHAEALDLNHYRVVSEVWHYSSIDWGNKCKNLLSC